MRLATEADLPRLLALQRAVLEAPQWIEASYRAALGDGEAAVEGRLRRLLVAVEVGGGPRWGGGQDAVSHAEEAHGNDAVGGRERGVIGFVVGQVLRVGGEVAEAEIESVVVAEAHRRAGIGHALCTALLAWFQAMAAETIVLEVRSRSQGAIALYRSLGFEEQGRRQGYYADPADDALLMRHPDATCG